MTQRIAALLTGITFLLAPVAVSAATLADIETQLMYVLGAVTALQAQQSGNPVVCALVASRVSVTAGEPFALIWNSFGAKDPSDDALESQWAQSGISTVTLDKPGKFKYTFTFNGASGGRTECSTAVTVTAAH